MIDYEIEEDGIDCVDEGFDEMERAWEDDEDNGDGSIPELYFSRPDPYAEHAMRQNDQRSRNYRIDEQGRIVVKNPSAWWIPEVKIMEEIDGTLYTVTGSYEGTEMLDQKLSRIMLHNLEDF